VYWEVKKSVVEDPKGEKHEGKNYHHPENCNLIARGLHTPSPYVTWRNTQAWKGMGGRDFGEILNLSRVKTHEQKSPFNMKLPILLTDVIIPTDTCTLMHCA